MKLKQNRYIVSLIVLLGASVTMALFIGIRQGALDRFALVFEKLSHDRMQVVAADIDLHGHELRNLCSFYEQSTEVAAREFSLYVKPLMEHPSVRTLEWIPLVRQPERAAFEARTGIRIREQDAAGQLVPARERAEYFPIARAEPARLNEAALGFDLGSNSLRWEALERARDQGDLSIMEQARLVESPTEPVVLMAVVAAYRQPSETLAERRRNLMGFVLGMYRVDKIVEHSLKGIPAQGLAVMLEDMDAPPETRLLCRHDPGIGTFDWSAMGDIPFRQEECFPVGGRTWRMTVVPNDVFIRDHLSRAYRWILPVGFVLTLLVAQLVRMQVYGRLRAERLVQERTADLRESENKFRALFEQSSDAQLIIRSGRFVECNQATLDMLGGISKAEFLHTHPAQWSPERQPDGRDSIEKADEMMAIAQQEGRYRLEWRNRRANGVEFSADVSLTSMSTSHKTPALHVIWSDITARKQSEGRAGLMAEVMTILNQHTPGGGLDDVHDILDRIYAFTGFDGVAIRLREGDDFPYYATRGFPEEFIRSEQFLCVHDKAGSIVRDAAGRPELRCVCGGVLRGQGGADLPFMTADGSFWTNSTSALCNAAQDRGYTCGRCHDAGYESLALIPLRSGSEMVGLLQLNDRKPGQFTEDIVHFFEGLGSSVGIALGRRQSEAELQRLSTAISQAAETVVVTDADGRIEYVNPAFEQISGYTAAEAIGQNPRILKSGEQDALFYLRFWNTISSGQTWTGRLVNKRKDGTLYTEKASVSPVRDAHGTVVNYVAVKRDITEELVREEQYRQSQKMDTVGRLAGGIAHDFNNILQTITGFCEILMGDMGGCMAGEPANCSAHRADVLEIHKAARHAAELTQQLLSFSRKHPAEYRIIELGEAVQDNLRMLHRVLDADVSIEYQPASAALPIKADSSQLMQVMMNLVVNARDAMPQGGAIHLQTEAVRFDAEQARKIPGVHPGEFACLSVSDSGTGMDADQLEHIFDPFFTTKKTGMGTGLGLAVVYGIVQNHRGWIDVHSEPGQGSTFRIHLPVCDEAVPVEPTQTDEPAVPQDGGRILLVEDDPVVCNLACEILRNAGYAVFPAGSRAEALALFGDGAFDLLFFDVVLPDCNGVDLAEACLRIHPGIPVLMFSGHSDERVDLETVRGKGFGFIRKPFNLRVLLDTVARTINDRKTEA